MSDSYSVVPGRGNDPNLPPINLPSMDVPQPRPRLRITVGAQPQPQPPASGPQAPPWADYPDVEAGAPQATPSKKPWEDYPDVGEKPHEREVGTGEALATGVGHGLTFGAAPVIQGLSEAAGKTREQLRQTEQEGIEAMPSMGDVAGGADIAAPFVGAAKLLHSYFSSHKDPEVVDAYNRGREEGLKNEKLAKEQHPAAFFGGVLAGSALTPAFSAFRAAGLGGRIVQGARGGGISGGLYGAGTETSEGGSPTDVAKSAMTGAATGAAIGAPIAAAVGPRVVQAAGRGARAAETAENLGAPIPVGTASDSRMTQGTTARVMSLPLVGERIGGKLGATEEAAGGRVEDIAGQLTGAPAGGRATAATLAAPGLRQAVENGRGEIDALYNALRGQIDQNARFTMPRTDSMLNQIMQRRAEAGWDNPAEGLDQFRRVASGATFNGAHRARVDAREAGNVLKVHPGYNASDFNAITRAMTQDLRDMVQAAATNQTRSGRGAALRAFDEAERSFGPLSEMNQAVRAIAEGGEGGIGTVIKAAQRKGGNIPLLAHLRRMMPQQEFDVLGGQMLSELGYSAGRDQFSLAQFATNFRKLSPDAIRTMFSPQHAEDLNRIAEMGFQIKRALAMQSTSHSSNWLALVDILKDVAILSHDLTSQGGFGKESLGALGTTAVLYGVGWMLGNSARAATTSRFIQAYSAITRNSPTPARIAAFNIATRNMANTLGISVEDVLRSIGSHTRADDQPEPKNETVQGKTQAPPK